MFVEELSEVVSDDYWVPTSDSSALINIKVKHPSRIEGQQQHKN